MATIVAAHDLSGAGRCSLTTALAVLPALGHTCYPLPTAVLSQQTGLPGYSFLDLTSELPAYLAGWEGLGLLPDLIYTGFLGNSQQAGLLAAFIARHPDAMAVVDPVMGDNGCLYDCFDGAFARNMLRLAREAHILIPNATEFNLLAGRPAAEAFPGTDGELLCAALSIAAPRLRYIIITSAVSRSGLCNIVIDLAGKTVSRLPCPNNGVAYSGAGDLFASLVCGRIISGAGIEETVAFAAEFVNAAVMATPQTSDPRLGIHYEPLLARLSELGGGTDHA